MGLLCVFGSHLQSIDESSPACSRRSRPRPVRTCPRHDDAAAGVIVATPLSFLPCLQPAQPALQNTMGRLIVGARLCYICASSTYPNPSPARCSPLSVPGAYQRRCRAVFIRLSTFIQAQLANPFEGSHRLCAVTFVVLTALALHLRESCCSCCLCHATTRGQRGLGWPISSTISSTIRRTRRGWISWRKRSYV